MTCDCKCIQKKGITLQAMMQIPKLKPRNIISHSKSSPKIYTVPKVWHSIRSKLDPRIPFTKTTPTAIALRYKFYFLNSASHTYPRIEVYIYNCNPITCFKLSLRYQISYTSSKWFWHCCNYFVEIKKKL